MFFLILYYIVSLNATFGYLSGPVPVQEYGTYMFG